jgi:hypothetical protein
MTRAEKEIYWREQFQKQEQSGLTKAEFCVQNGIRAEGFYRWRKKLTEQGAESVSNASRFLRVEAAPSSPRNQIKTVAPCTLHLGEDIELRMTELPSTDWLLELVRGMSSKEDRHAGM